MDENSRAEPPDTAEIINRVPDPGQTLTIAEEEENQLITGNTFPEIGPSMTWFLEKGFQVTSRNPYDNRHVPGQVDTLVTLSKGSSRVELYHAPGKYMVQSAEIHDQEVKIPGGIHTGLGKDQFFQRIGRPELMDQNLKVLILQNPVTETSVAFYFEGDAISHFHYRGYVD